VTVVAAITTAKIAAGVRLGRREEVCGRKCATLAARRPMT
jgi:hypothetical protein